MPTTTALSQFPSHSVFPKELFPRSCSWTYILLLLLLFCCCEQHLFSTVIKKHSLLHHSCADDSQLQKSAAPNKIPDLLLSKHKCIDEVKTWMTVNSLKLNVDTTEAMIVSSGRKSSSLSFSFPESVTIGSASVPTSDCQEPWYYN